MEEKFINFCRDWYGNLLKKERHIPIEIEQSYKQDKPFSHRKELLTRQKSLDIQKKIITASVKYVKGEITKEQLIILVNNS